MFSYNMLSFRGDPSCFFSLKKKQNNQIVRIHIKSPSFKIVSFSHDIGWKYKSHYDKCFYFEAIYYPVLYKVGVLQSQGVHGGTAGHLAIIIWL